MPKPVCVKCRRFMTVKQNGVAFEEMREMQASVRVTYLASYRLWLADLLACPSCGVEILVRAEGQKPVAEHFHSDYDDMRAALKPIVRVEG